MNWQNFNQYLQNNIVEENDNNITLREEAIDKYLGENPSMIQKNDLELAIIRLVLTLQGTINNIPSFHHLPTYNSNKTWERLIPRNIALGKVKGEEVELLDTTTYNLLGNIFNDWVNSEWEEQSEASEEPEEEEEEMVHNQLNWSKFRDWLENNLFQSDGTIKSAAKTKYRISNPDQLIATINNLIDSIKHDKYYEIDYHQLPHFCSPNTNLEGEEAPRVKTWTELFPTRERALFGKSGERELIDVQTFNILGAMHSDFIRPHKLASEVDTNNFLSKFMMEAIIHLNFNLIKQKGYDKFLTNWLSEYTKLTPEEQASLIKQKSTVERFIQSIAQESINQPSPTEQSSYWDKVKENGTTIAWIGGGILLVFLAWGFLKSKFK